MQWANRSEIFYFSFMNNYIKLFAILGIVAAFLNDTVNSQHLHASCILKVYYISLYLLDLLWLDSNLNSECNHQKKNYQQIIGSSNIFVALCKQIVILNIFAI